MSLREFWDTSPAYDVPAPLTLARLRELPLLDSDVRDAQYLQAAIAANHGNHAPDQINKAIRRRNPPPPRPTTGLLASTASGPLDLSDF